MLINADLCLIMLIYNRATGVLLTDCRKKNSIKRHDASITLLCRVQDGSEEFYSCSLLRDGNKCKGMFQMTYACETVPTCTVCE